MTPKYLFPVHSFLLNFQTHLFNGFPQSTQWLINTINSACPQIELLLLPLKSASSAAFLSLVNNYSILSGCSDHKVWSLAGCSHSLLSVKYIQNTSKSVKYIQNISKTVSLFMSLPLPPWPEPLSFLTYITPKSSLLISLLLFLSCHAVFLTWQPEWSSKTKSGHGTPLLKILRCSLWYLEQKPEPFQCPSRPFTIWPSGISLCPPLLT